MRKGTPAFPSSMDARAREILESLIDAIVAKVKPARILLFGSRARGDGDGRSDFDLAVERPDRARWVELALDLEESRVTLLKVDLVDLVDLDRASPEFRERILAEGVAVYECGNDEAE